MDKTLNEFLAAWVKNYLEDGYTLPQAKTLAWVEYAEGADARRSMASTGRIHCKCHDCNEGGRFIPSTVRDWIEIHRDHRTETFNVN